MRSRAAQRALPRLHPGGLRTPPLPQYNVAPHEEVVSSRATCTTLSRGRGDWQRTPLRSPGKECKNASKSPSGPRDENDRISSSGQLRNHLRVQKVEKRNRGLRTASERSPDARAPCPLLGRMDSAIWALLRPPSPLLGRVESAI